MRAIYITEFGGIGKTQCGAVPTPAPGRGEALVRVKAAALNHLDLWVLKGRPGLTLHEPHVMGSDAAGVIEALWPDCEDLGLKPGMEVVLHPGVTCMRCEFCLRGAHSECPHFKIIGFQLQGTFAELVSVPARNLFPKPAALSWAEAAALPLAHLTAWRMLFERARVQAGEMVLIHGIGGGVALAALQLCGLCGAGAIVTSSADEKLKKALALGAAAGINYRQTADVAKRVRELTGGRGVDVAFDTAGAPTLAASMAALRRGGRIVTCGITGGAEAQINLRELYWNHLSLLGSTLGSLEDMRRLARAAAAKPLKPVLDKVYPLAEYVAAARRMEAGEQFGKIVLEI